MGSRLAEAERRYHQSLQIPPQEKRWGVTELNEFWVTCCGTTSSLKFEDAASALDAAIEHYQSCPEDRRG